MKRPYAEVIGDPIAQSKSPVIHGFWLEALGLEAKAGESDDTRLLRSSLIGFLSRTGDSPELRAELQAKGYQFASTGDTEVIIKAWHAWGPAALDRLGLSSALTRQRANGLNSMVGRIRDAAAG